MFRFKLQPVLDQRQAKEDACLREYGEARARLEAMRRERAELETAIDRQCLDVRRRQAALSFAWRAIHESWIEDRRAETARLVARERDWAVEVERRRLRLVEAVKGRKIIETLRDRQLAEWRAEEARAERRLFDEIAVRDFNAEQRWEKDADQRERIAR